MVYKVYISFWISLAVIIICALLVIVFSWFSLPDDTRTLLRSLMYVMLG